MIRPPGHITELIRRIERWTKNRERLNLDTQPLRLAIVYLLEFRAFVAPHGEDTDILRKVIDDQQKTLRDQKDTINSQGVVIQGLRRELKETHDQTSSIS